VFIQIEYSPPSDFTFPSPPYYRPATSVTLTCHAHNIIGSVTYQWSSTCSSCFASSSTSQSVSDNMLTSADAGIHRCMATDADGSTGTNSTVMKLIGERQFDIFDLDVTDKTQNLCRSWNICCQQLLRSE